MSLTKADFHRELFLEHLEEASFLYSSRLAWRDDRELSWVDTLDLESRLDAHIEALIDGEEEAKTLCLSRIKGADVGELYALTSYLCKLQDGAALTGLWRTLIDILDYPPEEEEDEADQDAIDKIISVAEALRVYYPMAWRQRAAALLESEHQKLFPIVAPAIAQAGGISRQGAENLLSTSGPELLPRAIRIVADNGDAGHVALLHPYLQHENDEVVEAAGIALLRLGQRQVVTSVNGKTAALAIPIALAGVRKQTAQLQQLVRDGQVSSTILIALGLAGDLTSVNLLLRELGDKPFAPDAALALELMLGAALYQETFVPEQFAKEDLFEHELEAFQEGKSPQHPEGREFGVTVDQLCQEPAQWREWLVQNESRFDPSLRYRGGQPYSAQAVWSGLCHRRTPPQVRQWLMDELGIQFGLRHKLNINDPVLRQSKQLRDLSGWVREQSVAPTWA
ncbi:hypothetical protein ONV78_17855 [Hahella sp. CR1]|uniref:hypothetical protein n=1 Tax=Hahella sp. CR1 TaxID=2992807 RepID=UPI0024434178|nr:hypothetical protein [Hahella sp. CR1]MDG9669607.1 hypothetical protein [Hahella sp. CR1]